MNIEKTELVGIALPFKTTNENGQSQMDCGNLWQKFENEKFAERIPGKSGDEIYAVYHSYEGDHTNAFSYFIGCKVKPGSEVPAGMDHFVIPNGNYEKRIAKGKIPFCISEAWAAIWKSNIKRTYQTDFEIYDERSKDWNNGEVDIYLSLS